MIVPNIPEQFGICAQVSPSWIKAIQFPLGIWITWIDGGSLLEVPDQVRSEAPPESVAAIWTYCVEKVVMVS